LITPSIIAAARPRDEIGKGSAAATWQKIIKQIGLQLD
jgi:hypothetical protein